MKYVKGKAIGLADCLSRMSQKDVPETNGMDEELMVCAVDTLASSKHDKIENATNEDPPLQAVKELILNGWPETRQQIPTLANPYWDSRSELSTYGGIVFKGERICIPQRMIQETLKTIHSSHQGMVKSKQRARDIVYWPGMNKQVEEMVSKCSICLEYRDKPPKEPMIPHEIPSRPWAKVSCDLFELENKQYLVMADYYSGFIEVAQLLHCKVWNNGYLSLRLWIPTGWMRIQRIC